MGSKDVKLSFLFIFMLTLQSISSDSKSIVKNLPGFSGDLPFTLETGYIGVGEDEGVQAFYYFVESQRNPAEDPLFLYLTGGPGTSGLYPLLYQLGPLRFDFDIPWKDNITLKLNPYAWTKTANIIFVDLPAGSGFTYTKTWSASRSSDSILVSQSCEFISKWLKDHPKFLHNPLYISGTSYMGIIVPAVTLKIFNGNERRVQQELNIKGYLILSPLSDKFSDFNSRIEFAHRAALLSDDIYESAQQNCHENYIYVPSSNSLCLKSLQRVDECLTGINVANILDPLCTSANSGTTCGVHNTIYVDTWANDKAVQKALDVREGTIDRWEYKNDTIHYDLKKNDSVSYAYDIFSSVDYHKELTKRNCQALIISGDHDMTFPYVGVEKWINTLNLTLETQWKPWFVHNQVAGYQMTYANSEYSLNYATCKGSGHSIPLYKPEECSIMVETWLASQNSLSDS